MERTSYTCPTFVIYDNILTLLSREVATGGRSNDLS